MPFQIENVLFGVEPLGSYNITGINALLLIV
jgi:hypothetical protein